MVNQRLPFITHGVVINAWMSCHLTLSFSSNIISTIHIPPSASQPESGLFLYSFIHLIVPLHLVFGDFISRCILLEGFLSLIYSENCKC